MLCTFSSLDRDYEGVVTCDACGHIAVKKKGFPYYRNCKSSKHSVGTAGTHLKVLLQSLLLANTKSCRCESRAEHMNHMGNDWCEQNIETIVGWMKEEAAARGLPFVSAIGRLLVQRAIRNARKDEDRQ